MSGNDHHQGRDADRERENRLLELQANLLNTTGAHMTVLGIAGCPIMAVFGRDLLPFGNWLTVGAMFALLGFGLHLLARMTLKAMR